MVEIKDRYGLIISKAVYDEEVGQYVNEYNFEQKWDEPPKCSFCDNKATRVAINWVDYPFEITSAVCKDKECRNKFAIGHTYEIEDLFCEDQYDYDSLGLSDEEMNKLWDKECEC